MSQRSSAYTIKTCVITGRKIEFSRIHGQQSSIKDVQSDKCIQKEQANLLKRKITKHSFHSSPN